MTRPRPPLLPLILLLAVLLGTTTSSCWCVYNGLDIEPTPDFENPIGQKTGEVSYQIPGNWTAETSTEMISDIKATTTTMESIGDILVIVLVYEPVLEGMTAEGFLDVYIKTLDESVEDLGKGAMRGGGETTTAAPARKLLGVDAEGIRGDYTMSMLGENEKFILMVYTVKTEARTIISLLQASKGDEAVAEEAFSRILDSMVTP